VRRGPTGIRAYTKHSKIVSAVVAVCASPDELTVTAGADADASPNPIPVFSAPSSTDSDAANLTAAPTVRRRLTRIRAGTTAASR
jgi:hypothetical protein